MFFTGALDIVFSRPTLVGLRNSIGRTITLLSVEDGITLGICAMFFGDVEIVLF